MSVFVRRYTPLRSLIRLACALRQPFSGNSRLRTLWPILLFSTLLLAQDLPRGEVQGVVLDMRSKPIVGAHVVYTNVDSGKEYRLLTDKSGHFHGIGLLVGNYGLEITSTTGRRIYSGRQTVSVDDKSVLNVVDIDLSLVPSKPSLAAFSEPSASDLQSAKWRKPREQSTAGPQGAMGADPIDTSRYHELYPQTQAALKARRWPQALDLLQQMAAIAPSQWELYQNMGTVQLYLKQYQQAADAFEKSFQALAFDDALKADPVKFKLAMAGVLVAEGQAYDAGNDHDAASWQYQRASQLSPGHFAVQHNLCIAAYNSGNYEAAIEACKKSVAADPSRPESYQILGQIQVNLGKYADAAQTLAKGIELAETGTLPPSPHSATINPCSIPTPSGNSQKDSIAGEMMVLAGNAYFQLKKFDEAAAMFKRAVLLHPYPALT